MITKVSCCTDYYKSIINSLFRSVLYCILVLCLFVVFFSAKSNFSILVIAAIFLAAAFFWLFYTRVRFQGLSSLKISYTDARLILPTPLGLSHFKVINLRDIKTVQLEPMPAGWITIETNTGNPIRIFPKMFADENQFKRFAEHIDSRYRFYNNQEKRSDTLALFAKRLEKTPIGLLLFVTFLLSTFYFLPIFYFDIRTIVEIGGASKFNILNGELYRLFSYLIIHANIKHLFLNTCNLLIVGEIIFRTLGSVRSINLLLISGISSAFLSASFSSFDTTVGASGAIYGLLGCYIYLRVFHNQDLPPSIKMSSKTFLLTVIPAFELIVFLTMPNVSLIAHLGGFLAGFSVTALIPMGRNLRNVASPHTVEKLICVLLLISFFISILKYCQSLIKLVAM